MLSLSAGRAAAGLWMQSLINLLPARDGDSLLRWREITAAKVFVDFLLTG